MTVTDEDREAERQALVTDADNDAVRAYVDSSDPPTLAQAFAAHRIAAAQAERDAVVKWLREQSEIYRSEWAVSVDPHVRQLAQAIEAGEHLAEHHVAKEG